MREINLNGYIDDGVWWGDEITPEALHEVLYGVDGQMRDDVHICLNSYGGSCNAATRMFDDIRAYPGNVAITISGTAASAATVLAMAADRLEMTLGSLFMIHDPIVGAVGNERELSDAIRLLQTCKDSILNVYAVRCRLSRNDVSEKMTDTCWMDAQAALANGFIDGITEGIRIGETLNAGEAHIVDRAEAEKKVRAWIERKSVRLSHSQRNVDIQPLQEDVSYAAADVQTGPVCETESEEILAAVDDPADDPTDAQQASMSTAMPKDNTSAANAPSESTQTASAPPASAPPASDPPNKPNIPTTEQPENTGTPVAQLHKRLGLIMPSWR